MKFFQMGIILLTALSCSTGAIYHIEVSGRNETYTETPKGGSIEGLYTDVMAVPVTTLKGDDSRFKTSGYGFQIGITEELKYLQSTLSFYSQKFDQLDYIFNIDGTDTPVSVSASGIGLEASMALKIWWFRPNVNYKYEKMTVKSISSASESIFFIGYGIGLDIPVSDRFTLYGSWNMRFRIQKNDFIDQKNMLILGGLRYRLSEKEKDSSNNLDDGRWP